MPLVYQIPGVLAETTRTGAVVQARFMRANFALRDRSPVRALHDHPMDRVGAVMLTTARAFTATR